MKKTNLFLVTTIVMSTILPATTVNAAITANDEGASASTTAQFTVKAGSLSLDSAPDFSFGEQNIADILPDTVMNQTSSNIIDDSFSREKATDVGEKLDNTSSLKITDYRGAGNKWKLMASLSSFENVTPKATGSVTGSITFDGKTIPGGENVTPAEIWNSDDAGSNGLGSKELPVNNATLKIDKATDIQAGTYQATVNWNLQNTSTEATKG